MKDDAGSDPKEKTADRPRPALRPASFFRSIAMAALASMAPAAGCYDSYDREDAVEDGGDAAEDARTEDGRSDDARADDATADDGARDDAEEILPPYGGPVYGVPGA